MEAGRLTKTQTGRGQRGQLRSPQQELVWSDAGVDISTRRQSRVMMRHNFTVGASSLIQESRSFCSPAGTWHHPCPGDQAPAHGSIPTGIQIWPPAPPQHWTNTSAAMTRSSGPRNQLQKDLSSRVGTEEHPCSSRSRWLKLLLPLQSRHTSGRLLHRHHLQREGGVVVGPEP